MSDQYTKWIQIGSNIAVLVGLILIIIEMNLNRELSQAQIISDGYGAQLQLDSTFMGENPMDVVAKSISDPSMLTDSELLIMDNYLFSAMRVQFRRWDLVENGIYGDQSNFSTFSQAWANYYFGNEFAQNWYRTNKAKGEFAGTWESAIDRAISNVDPMYSTNYIDDLKLN